MTTRHRRQPSINSQTFAVPETEVSDVEEMSTDSYQDSIDEDHETREFDPVEYLNDSLENALTSMEMNRSMVIQAQTSGALKGKELELIQLQQEAEERLLQFQKRFKDGLKTLRQVVKDLKWTQQHVSGIRKHLETNHPIEYSQSRDKILSRNINIDEITKKNDDDDDNDDAKIYI
ncbi:hypothetical protein BN7_1502 [Wickerhamomyces ciferrii]|uniref:Biogenesis of lysosome-related organelles complex 1 subunit KXD1 n=1 Tax=Wickerhamomyces ciferrii (strain ATCC 14091 / BCRC 22168 / CBS 111 / JCM 3599 / NBRC 0793 / NRRL Y-1031 F-60-10) TaxID=1206466 RepID=K0KLG8_WICCF|nr:uncharacterized protein BN7_1502 [Wickerhamomyces ciferrii]CCH41963.1 hypothetical protein BN7_1502 [Wickerhamomyces ciferrii]